MFKKKKQQSPVTFLCRRQKNTNSWKKIRRLEEEVDKVEIPLDTWG